jgi:hypothetical protein
MSFDDNELPGMWSHSDLIGGKNDDAEYFTYQVDCFQCDLFRTFDNEDDAEEFKAAHPHRATLRKIPRVIL